MLDNIIRIVWKWLEAIFKTGTRLFYKLADRELSESEWPAHAEFWKFLLVGLTSSAVQYVVYAAVLLIFGTEHYLPASVVSFFCSTLYSFVCNDRYVFPGVATRSQTIKAFFRTLLTYSVTGLLLYNVLLFVLIDLLHVSEFLAPIITMVALFPVNYLLSKFWAFGGKKKRGEKEGDAAKE